MQNNIKLKKLIEETFEYKCKEDCEYIYASSSEELGEKIRKKIQSAYKINCYEFTTNSGCSIRGSLPSQSAALENLGCRITDLKIGYIEIRHQIYLNNPIETFAFGIFDSTKKCIEMICNVGKSKNIELSTYSDLANLQKDFVDIISEDENSKYTLDYTIFRENENYFGKIEGTGKERIKDIIDASENIKKHSEYITAVSIQKITDDKKDKELKHYVLFMV